MGDRLFGIETEYALSATDARGRRLNQGRVLDRLMRSAQRQLPHLPDGVSHGLFLQNGARFYVDSGGHPEFTTPECNNPWDVVRYIRAGESILLRLSDSPKGKQTAGRMAFFRCNVDYSGTGSTWGCHESYMCRVDLGSLPKQVIPHLVSRLVYAGAGGFNNLSPGIEFTLSPRTAHMTQEMSSDSTSDRGIFHTKDEALCGNGYHRLHILCGESLCSELAIWLKVGVTALIVAMCEAGLYPGDAVQLREPVAAMRLFASDPTCTAAAEATSGERLTAVAIQRHYLEQAEAHVGDAFMPVWAGDVCRRWRAVLHSLDNGWESVATTLDWAIKLGLYQNRVSRRGLRWGSLASWVPVAERLSASLARARQPELSLSAEIVLGRTSPIADDVEQMIPFIQQAGLSMSDLGPFLETRNELFEIDTRFGQLGEKGIFTALDAAGVLSHRVDGVDDIEHAVSNPPEIARAQLRGQLVRELSGNDGRYCCGWEGVWDCETGKGIDLSDPFVVTPEWKDSTRGGGRRARSGMDPNDPVDLNNAALEHRRRDQLEEAERLLRRAIEIEDRQVAADSPKRPHRRNNLAMVLMRAAKFDEAHQLNAEAWLLKAGQHDLTSGRILFVRIALRLLEEERDTNLYMGQLKTLLHRDPLECRGDILLTWDIPDVLAMLDEKLPEDDTELLTAMAAALNDREHLLLLEVFDTWNAAPAMPLETPWPDD